MIDSMRLDTLIHQKKNDCGFKSEQDFMQTIQSLSVPKRFKYLCAAKDGSLSEVGILTVIFEKLKGLLGFKNRCEKSQLEVSLKWMTKAARNNDWINEPLLKCIEQIGKRAGLLDNASQNGKFRKFIDKISAFIEQRRGNHFSVLSKEEEEAPQAALASRSIEPVKIDMTELAGNRGDSIEFGGNIRLEGKQEKTESTSFLYADSCSSDADETAYQLNDTQKQYSIMPTFVEAVDGEIIAEQAVVLQQTTESIADLPVPAEAGKPAAGGKGIKCIAYTVTSVAFLAILALAKYAFNPASDEEISNPRAPVGFNKTDLASFQESDLICYHKRLEEIENDVKKQSSLACIGDRWTGRSFAFIDISCPNDVSACSGASLDDITRMYTSEIQSLERIRELEDNSIRMAKIPKIETPRTVIKAASTDRYNLFEAICGTTEEDRLTQKNIEDDEELKAAKQRVDGIFNKKVNFSYDNAKIHYALHSVITSHRYIPLLIEKLMTVNLDDFSKTVFAELIDQKQRCDQQNQGSSRFVQEQALYAKLPKVLKKALTLGELSIIETAIEKNYHIDLIIEALQKPDFGVVLKENGKKFAASVAYALYSKNKIGWLDYMLTV